MIFGVKRDPGGRATAAVRAFESVPPRAPGLPPGYEACSAEEYEAARAALWPDRPETARMRRDAAEAHAAVGAAVLDR